MKRREFIATVGAGIVAACEDENEPIMLHPKVKRIVSALGGRTYPWWQANGLIPDSTGYTIYDPLSSADLASSYINKANPGTRDALPGVAPTFPGGSGWLFNGTTQYLDTQSQDLSSNETTVIWVENWQGVYAFGSSKILNRPYLSGTPFQTRLTYTTNVNLYGSSVSGIIIMRAGLAVYRFGRNLAALGAYPAGTNRNIYIGCQNSGAPTSFGSGNVYRFARYNFALSDAQCEALCNSIQSDINTTAPSSYETTMLASNPVAYFPMQNLKGAFAIDKVSGYVMNGQYPNTLSVGQTGPTGKGNSYQGVNITNGFLTPLDNWLNGTLLWDEVSVAFWIKNVNANVQARPCNAWINGSAEYFAPEIRSGNLAIFFKETGGYVWNTVTLVVPPDQTWCQIVAYNSKSAGVCGVYLNGVKTEVSRGAAPGFTSGGICTLGYPYILQSMSGYMCHFAFYDHALSQAEVDAIYVP